MLGRAINPFLRVQLAISTVQQRSLFAAADAFGPDSKAMARDETVRGGIPH